MHAPEDEDRRLSRYIRVFQLNADAVSARNENFRRVSFGENPVADVDQQGNPRVGRIAAVWPAESQLDLASGRLIRIGRDSPQVEIPSRIDYLLKISADRAGRIDRRERHVVEHVEARQIKEV